MNKTKFGVVGFAIACCVMSCSDGSKKSHQKIPMDPNVRYGTLDNGLTYYIRHNDEPKNRCEFHLAQAVGATLEEDNQNGLAHFLEHMAFNGTTNFPDKSIIDYFESVGVNFGGDINAYTSLDETVYRLSNVPTVRQGIIDSALLVMHDWANGILMLDEEIDAERGVIREEWRTGANAQRRMWKKSNAQKYPGSQYAKRDVIGDTAVINNFSYDELRDYYKKWYGPDLQAVVVVGDINVDSIEAKIKEIWADVPARANRGERPIHDVPNNDEPIVAIVTDREAQYTRIELEYKHNTPPREKRLSTEGARQDLIAGIISTVMDYRFNEITQKPDAPYVIGACYYTNITKSKDGFVMLNIAKPSQEMQACKDLMMESERLKRYGITESEFKRAEADITKQYEQAYNERDNKKNTSYVNEYIRHYLDAKYAPGIEWEYNHLQELFSDITLAEVNATAASYITDNNLIISFMLPETANTVIPKKAEVLALLSEVQSSEIEAPKEDDLNKPLVATEPKAGTVAEIKKNDAVGTTELTLSNGVRIVTKTTDFKKDEILMSATSLGGWSTINDLADLPSAMFAADIVENNGLGDFSYVDLQKKLTGKIARVSPSISTYREGFSGNSSISDLETMLQLIYLNFTAVRQDDDAYAALMSLINTSLANRDKDPKTAFKDSVEVTLAGHSPRVLLIDQATAAKVDQIKGLEIFKQRFANAADFRFIFTGNIDGNDKATQELLCKWLGSLPAADVEESFVDRDIRTPKGDVENYFTREMEIKTASNRIQYTGGMDFNLVNNMNMRVIGEVLSMRYLESIREKEGGSYGVGVAGYINPLPVAEANLLMQFDTDPLKQKKLISIIHKEVDTIIKDGPRADDLQKVKENMLKDYAQNIETNNWWHGTVLTNYYNYGINYVADYKSTVEGISSESIKKTLKKLVDQKNEAEIVMMPK